MKQPGCNLNFKNIMFFKKKSKLINLKKLKCYSTIDMKAKAEGRFGKTHKF